MNSTTLSLITLTTKMNNFKLAKRFNLIAVTVCGGQKYFYLLCNHVILKNLSVAKSGKHCEIK
jgi:hypothetical protein